MGLGRAAGDKGYQGRDKDKLSHTNTAKFGLDTIKIVVFFSARCVFIYQKSALNVIIPCVMCIYGVVCILIPVSADLFGFLGTL